MDFFAGGEGGEGGFGAGAVDEEREEVFSRGGGVEAGFFDTGDDFREVDEDGVGFLAGVEGAELAAFSEGFGGTLGGLVENFGGGRDAAGGGEGAGDLGFEGGSHDAPHGELGTARDIARKAEGDALFRDRVPWHGAAAEEEVRGGAVGDDGAGAAEFCALGGGEVDAVAEDGFGAEQAAAFVDRGVVGELGEERADGFDFEVVFGEVGLDPGAVFAGEACGGAHHFRGAGNGEPGGDGVFEPAARGAVPALDEAAGLFDGNGEDFVGFEVAVGMAVHHDFPDDGADAGGFGGGEAFVRAVFVDGGVEDGEGGAVAGEGLEEKRGEGAGFGGAEIFFGGENVALEPGEEGFLDAGDEGVLRDVGVDVDEPGDDGAIGSAEPLGTGCGGEFGDFRKTAAGGDAAVFDKDGSIGDSACGVARGGVEKEAAEGDGAGVHGAPKWRRVPAGISEGRPVRGSMWQRVSEPPKAGVPRMEASKSAASEDLPGGWKERRISSSSPNDTFAA